MRPAGSDIKESWLAHRVTITSGKVGSLFPSLSQGLACHGDTVILITTGTTNTFQGMVSKRFPRKGRLLIPQMTDKKTQAERRKMIRPRAHMRGGARLKKRTTACLPQIRSWSSGYYLTARGPTLQTCGLLCSQELRDRANSALSVLLQSLPSLLVYLPFKCS